MTAVDAALARRGQESLPASCTWTAGGFVRQILAAQDDRVASHGFRFPDAAS
jgi:hypothetical protein